MIKGKIFLILSFMCIFFISSSPILAKKLVTLTEIKQPKGLAVDDQQLYITENATVFIYSLKDFSLIKQFGSKGQGPQEFQTLPHVPISVDVSTDKLIVASIRKISYFTKSGEFLNEIRAASLALKLRRCNNRFLAWSQAKDKDVTYNTVNLYDETLHKIQEVFRMKDTFQGAGRGFTVLHRVFTYHTIHDKILLPGSDDSTVEIFDMDMKKLSTIRLDQKPIPVDAATRDKLTHYLKNSPESKNIYPMLKPLIFPDHFPVIADFFVDDVDKGIIYVMTWKRENGANEFFIYDLEGHFKKRLMIPIQYETDLGAYPIIVKKGLLYQLIESESDETWEFHATPIEEIASN